MNSQAEMPSLDDVRRACALIQPHVIDQTRDDLRQASVCIAICGGPRPFILLIERVATMRSHAGQWGLPGGRRDPGETREETACRELEEELGIPRDAVRVEGRLDDFVTRSGYVISPVVVSFDAETDIQLNPAEIANWFTISLSELVEPDRFVWFEVAETGRRAIKMHVKGEFLYAPAAAMLFQFREVLRGEVVRVLEIEQPVFAWR